MNFIKLSTLVAFLALSHFVFSQAPLISSFSPSSGTPGSTVTITGNNFSTTTGTNVVYFGSVRAAVTSASGTTLNVRAPLGASYQPITVTVSGNTGFSKKPFLLTAPNVQPLTAATFLPHADFAVAATPGFLTYGDLDADGITDVLMTTAATNLYNISAFRNTSDCKNLGLGMEKTIFSNSAQPDAGTATGDFDGDGLPDGAVSEPANKWVTVFQNLSYPGTISLQNGQALGTNTLPTGDVKIADMDGDGKPDIVVGLFNALGPASGVAIYRNTSSGPGVFSFAAPSNIVFPVNPSSIALADLDGDGKSEIILTDGATSVHVRRNKATAGILTDASFDPDVAFATAATPRGIRTGDLDGDGNPDLAIACAASVSILRNTATGGSITTSSLAAHIDLTGNSTAIDLGDLNGDGKVDVATANGSTISLWQNQSTSGSLSTSSFGGRVDLSIGTASISQLAVFDVNSDGLSDISATQTGSSLSVFLNKGVVQPAPVITSISPASGIAGATVTIQGNNFGTSAAANAVFMGATKATITSATATQLTVTVPDYATLGPVIVENLTYGLQAASAIPFTPTFDHNKDFGGRIIPASLGAPAHLNVGTVNAFAVNIGDIDGDGLGDIVASGSGNDSITIFRNKGNKIAGPAGFEKIRLYFDTDGNGEVFPKDIDGDGKLDIVMITRGLGDTDEVLIFHNESTPGSLSAASFGPVFQVHFPFLHINDSQLKIYDMDGDGKPELVCQNFGAISVFKNNSQPGSFCFAPSVDITASGYGIAVGDIDGDGKADIATAKGFYGGAGFFLIRNTSGAGTLSFGAPVLFTPPASPSLNNVIIADVDNDGKPDVSFVTTLASGGVGLHVMKNIATAGTIDASSLAAEVTYYWNNAGTSTNTLCTIGDINGDGKPDIIASNYSIGIFQNASANGTIDADSFLNGVTFNFPVNYSASYPAAGDLDGDGKPEIVCVVTSYSANEIWILHNENYPAPRIDQLQNTSSAGVENGAVGAPITTTGDFQYTSSTTPLIRFGAVSAMATNPTNTSVHTSVPAGTSTDRVSVTLHGLTGFSNDPFITTFSTNGKLDGTTFTNHIDYQAETGVTRALAVVDFDNDGKPDIAAGDGGKIHLFQSLLSAPGADLTTSSFSSLPSLPNSMGTLPLAWGDFDGDGLVDLQGNSSLFRNVSAQPGTIAFDAPVPGIPGTNFGVGPKTNIDFNHDGKTDLLSAYTSGSLYINENLSVKGPFNTGASTTTFGQAISYNGLGTFGDVGAGDFDGDGYDDVVYLIKSTNQLFSMLNTQRNREISNASFATAQPTATDASPTYLSVLDFDGDGKPDIAVGYSAAASISVFRNTSTIGAISFSKYDFPSLPNTVGISGADLTGDGLPEIVTIHSGNAFSIFENVGDGTPGFNPKIDYTLPDVPTGGLVLADVNLDGKADILITHGATTISVYPNTLTSVAGIVVTTQPSSRTVCNGTTAVFTVAASGTTNITYQWAFSSTSSGTFADLAEGGGYTGVSTASLGVAATSAFGAGFYRCRINGDKALQVISSSAQLSISTSGCGGAAPTIKTEELATVPGGTITIDLILLISTSGVLDTASITIVTPPGSHPVTSINKGVLTIDYSNEPAYAGTDSITISACDKAGMCAQQTFKIDVITDIVIYHGISVNGKNPIFFIQYIGAAPNTKNNHVSIFNRWGDEVYSASNYDNTNVVFSGVGKSGNQLPTGTYFYVLDLPDRKKTLRGYLSLKN